MRISIPFATAAATALFLTAPARADITSVRYSYPGDCSAQKARTAGPNDVVTLVFGEPLDLDLLGTGLEAKAQIAGFAAGADQGPRLEAPSGIATSILSSSPNRVIARLLVSGTPPARTTPPITLKLVRGTTTLGSFQVRVAVRPRIERIRLGIPGTESLTDVKLISRSVYPLALAGVGLSDLSLGASSGRWLRQKNGVFELVATDSTTLQITPADFRWALDSCPLKGPGDAALSATWDWPTRLAARAERQALPRPVSCGTEFRNVIDDSWCASLPAPHPQTQAVVDAPPLRWTVQAPRADIVVGACTAVLQDHDNKVLDRRPVRYLRPGETISFETTRPGLRRHVMRDQACVNCIDLGGSPSAWDEQPLIVELQPPP